MYILTYCVFLFTILILHSKYPIYMYLSILTDIDLDDILRKYYMRYYSDIK